jgi:hypothetical protein
MEKKKVSMEQSARSASSTQQAENEKNKKILRSQFSTNIKANERERDSEKCILELSTER